MNKKRNRALKKLGATALAGTLLVTGSLAWQDVSQHKTNNFSTKTIEHSAVLVENFEQVDEWELGQDVQKQVYVRNGQDTDNADKYEYTDGYIRIQLREFMGIANETYTMSDDRLMIDTNGDFLRFETQTEVDAKIAELGLNGDRAISLKGINDDKAYFYIKTMADDDNGQYGKFLMMSVEEGDLVSLESGEIVTDIDSDVALNHNNTDQDNPNIEDTDIYTTHTWSEYGISHTDISYVFSQYVRWTLGPDVITLNQWKEDYDGKPVAKWIVDTSDSTNGYAYWGEQLSHYTNIPGKSVTSDFLESVQLIKQPQGHAEYRIHVNMDAVSYNDLNLWTDANPDIVNAFKETNELADLLAELAKAIDRGENADISGKTSDSIQALKDAISNGKDIYAAGGPTLKEVQDAITEINEAITGLKISYRVKIEELLPEAKSDQNYVDKYFVNVTKWDNLDSSIKLAENLLSNTNATESQYENAFNRLQESLATFEDGKAIGKIYETVYVSDRIFYYVKEHSGNALIMSKDLTKSDLDKMGMSQLSNSSGYVVAVSNASENTKYKGYDSSNLKKIDSAFYNTFIANSNHVSRVNPVKVNVSSLNTNNWNTRNDGLTMIDLNNGQKTAFALSVADIISNKNGSPIQLNKLGVNRSVGLRDNGSDLVFIADINKGGTITSSKLTTPLAMRPSLWVTLP